MFIQMIEQKAGFYFDKIGVPQPEDIVKATARDTLKKLVEVNEEVIPVFEDAADDLIDAEGGDAKRAL